MPVRITPSRPRGLTSPIQLDSLPPNRPPQPHLSLASSVSRGTWLPGEQRQSTQCSWALDAVAAPTPRDRPYNLGLGINKAEHVIRRASPSGRKPPSELIVAVPPQVIEAG